MFLARRLSIEYPLFRGEWPWIHPPLPVEDKYLSSKDELERNIAGILGGTAAERVVFDEISTGASNDIRKATDIARKWSPSMECLLLGQ